MNRSLAAGLIFLLTLSCVLIYRVVDLGNKSTFLESSVQSQKFQANVVLGLLKQEWIGLRTELVVERIKRFATANPTLVVKGPDPTGRFQIEELVFTFRDGKLSSISLQVPE